MNTVLIVLFVIVIASFITGVCFTLWENKHNTKLVFSNDKVVNKIITLSTCTNDNTGRKVIHAKLVSQGNY